ncbi:hypothetical protein ACWDA3_28780 [Nonomuraea rubra]
MAQTIEIVADRTTHPGRRRQEPAPVPVPVLAPPRARPAPVLGVARSGAREAA